MDLREKAFVLGALDLWVLLLESWLISKLDLRQKAFILGALDLWVLLPESWLNKFHHKQIVRNGFDVGLSRVAGFGISGVERCEN